MRSLAICCTLILNCFSLEIVLYLNLIAKTHLSYAKSLIDVLQERGHNVDLVVSNLNTLVKFEGATNARNLTSISFPGESEWVKLPHLTDPFEAIDPIDMKVFYKLTIELCEIAIKEGKTLEFLKNGKYDVMLYSDFDWCGPIMAHASGINSTIGFVPNNMMMDQTIHLGLPNPISCVIGNFDIDARTSLIGRIVRLAKRWLNNQILVPSMAAAETAVARKYFGSNFPDAMELAMNYDVVFVNSNEIIENPRTLTSKVHYIGGISMAKPKILDNKFDGILSKSLVGTVLVSFGTQVSSEIVNVRVKRALVNVFKRFPKITFIWKYTIQSGDDNLLQNTTNVELVDWLPQTDLLYDGRVSCFITHAGLNSFLETSHAGVPIIVIPLFADQYHNARSAHRLGTGIHLDKLTLSEDVLYDALNKILYDNSYRERARNIAKMLRDKPNKPKDIFINWVEYAATHSGLHKHLSLAEARQGVFTYYCMDLALLISSAIFVAFVVLKQVFRFVLSVVSYTYAKLQKVKTA